jgi:hypothetical protein
MPINAYQFPSKPTKHASTSQELLKLLKQKSSMWETIGLTKSITIRAEQLNLNIPVKLLGVNDSFGRKPSLTLVSEESNGGTLFVSSDCMIENLRILSDSRDQDFDDDQSFFPSIDVQSDGRLILRNCIVNSSQGSALMVFGQAIAENCSLQSLHYEYPSFLGAVAQNEAILTLINCDLTQNQWGCFLGQNLTEEREKVIRRYNKCSPGDEGVTRMYDMTQTVINPWY